MIGEQPPESTADKGSWRRWARDRWRTVDVDSASIRIVAHLAASGMIAGTVLTYLAMEDEIDLAPLMDLVQASWAITRTPSVGPLTVHPVGVLFEEHSFGFLQPVAAAEQIDPATLDVLLLPGLVFDRHGGRLGRGKGYMDGLIARVRPDAVTIGIVPASLVVDRVPMTEGDRRVRFLATERAISEVWTGKVGDPVQ